MPSDGPQRDPTRDYQRPFELFISYAHKREAMKDRLLGHLSVLKRPGAVSTWTDRAIPPGSNWRDEIEDAISRADGVVFIVCEYFLKSGFCMDEEMPAFLQRWRDEGILVLFVFADHCYWRAVPEIAEHQMVPRDGKPIIAFRPQSKAYTAVVQEIHQVLDAHRAAHGLALRGPVPSPELAIVDSASGATILAGLLAKIPGQTNQLFGRKQELERLDAGPGSGHREGAAVGRPRRGRQAGPHPLVDRAPGLARRHPLHRPRLLLPGQPRPGHQRPRLSAGGPRGPGHRAQTDQLGP